MVDVPIVVAFGASEESFFVGAGRRYFIQNMPASLEERVPDLPVGSIIYMNVDKTGEYWASATLSGNVYYRLPTNLADTVVEKGCQLITFPDFDPTAEYYKNDVKSDGIDSPYWFIKYPLRGSWKIQAPPIVIDSVKPLREQVQDFDDGLQWVIFGKNGTQIWQTGGFFVNALEKPHDDPEHPLKKVLDEFGAEPAKWVLERGSSMSLYDDRWFFLRFRNRQTGAIQMRWHLPPTMSEKLNTLLEEAKAPGEQEALQEEEMVRQQSLVVRMAQMNMQASMSNAMANQMRQGAISISNIVGGTQYELVQKPY